MVRKMFQYTMDPRDAAETQTVGVHEFVKKTFSRAADHPILEAPNETELGLSDSSKQVKFAFKPSLLSDWVKVSKRSKEEQASFLEKKCEAWGIEELVLPDH